MHPDFLEREGPSGLRREKNQQQSQVRLNFKVFNDAVNNRAKALDKKQETNFVGGKTEIGGEKMRKSGQQAENELQCRKKVNRNTKKHR